MFAVVASDAGGPADAEAGVHAEIKAGPVIGLDHHRRRLGVRPRGEIGTERRGRDQSSTCQNRKETKASD